MAGLLAAALLAAFAPDLLAPWVLLREATPGYTAELHRWHGADSGAFVGLLVCGSLLALIPRPRGWSGSVFTVATITSALLPLVIHIFVPLTT